MVCLSWNVCRLGNKQTRNAIDNLCISHKPDLVAIYEPKITKDALLRNFLHKLNLTFLTNNERPNMRLNIWIVCRPQLADLVNMIAMSSQFITIRNEIAVLVFVHSKKNCTLRRSLWQDLINNKESPICIMGDFNVVLGAHKRSSRVLSHVLPSEDF